METRALLSMLVVATSGTGFVLESGSAFDLAGLCWTCTETIMVTASVNSLNQVFEISNDAKMKRTMRRPLPSGRTSIPLQSLGHLLLVLLALPYGHGRFLQAMRAHSSVAAGMKGASKVMEAMNKKLVLLRNIGPQEVTLTINNWQFIEDH